MKKILVVDDDANILQVIEDALSTEYLIFSVANGNDAQSLLSKQKFDLLITDMVMPGVNGIDLIMNVQKYNQHQKIIAISGGSGGISGRFDYLQVAQLIGALIVMRKPFQITELRSAVHKLLA